MSVILRKKTSRLNRAKEIEEGLRNIYGREKRRDLARIEYKKTSHLTAFLARLVIGLFVLSLISWGGFLWWQNQNQSTAKPLRAEFEAPSSVAAGQSFCFKFKLTNSSNVPLASLSTAFNLPKNFTIVSTNPAPTESVKWILPPLGAGSDNAINICGLFRSAVPSVEKIQAVLNYRPANFNSDFQDIASIELVIDKTVLETTIAGPTETVIGDNAVYVIKIKNTDTEKTENFRLRLLLPSSFLINNATPPVSEEGSAYWNIAALEAGAEQEIKFTGTFTNAASGLTAITAETGFLNAQQDFFKQNETKAESNVLGGDLAFHLIVNGSEKDQTVDSNGRLRLSIDYANQGKYTLNNVSFSLVLSAGEKILPVSFASSDLGEGERSNNTIVWDKKGVVTLTALAPGASEVIDAVLIVPESIDPSTTADSFSMLLTAEVEQVGSTTSSLSILASPIVIKINSDANLLAEARYFDHDGAPLGSGPLPPTVGQTTNYRVFWSLTNELHDLKNVSTTMTLPASVSWTGNLEAEVGSLEFNESTRQLNWEILQFTKEQKTAAAWFDISITPSTEDIGSFLILTNPISLEATDAVTNDLIHDAFDSLTTALPNDEWAEGKGVVE